MTEGAEQWWLLRGLGREAGHWGEFPHALGQALTPATVHTLDLPGTGVRWREASPLSVPAIARVVRQGSMQPCERRFVLAMSLGAMVALEWLCRYPHELAGAVLINASVGGINPFWQRLRPSVWWPLLQTAMTRDPFLREERIIKMTSNKPITRDGLEERVAIHRSRPFHRGNLLRQLFAASHYRLPVQRSSGPVLLLVGNGDRFVNPLCSRTLQRALNAELVMHETANHDLPFEDPLWVIAQIAAWRTRHDKSRW